MLASVRVRVRVVAQLGAAAAARSAGSRALFSSLGWPHYHDDCCPSLFKFATGTMPTGRQGGPGSPARPGKELYSMRVLCYVDDPDSVARGRTSHSHWQPQGPSPCGLPSHGSHQGLRHSVALSERQCAQVAVTLRCDSGGSFWFGQMPGWGIGLGFLPPRDRRPAFCPTPLAAKFSRGA